MSALVALDAINDPVFLLRTDGSIRHRNRAANEEFPSSSLLGERLSPVSPGARKFARYLSSCAGSTRPFPGAIDLLCGSSVSRYRCRGSLIRDGARGPSQILLHLLPGRDLRPRMLDQAPPRTRSEARHKVQPRTAIRDHEAIRTRVERERDGVLCTCTGPTTTSGCPSRATSTTRSGSTSST